MTCEKNKQPNKKIQKPKNPHPNQNSKLNRGAREEQE